MSFCKIIINYNIATESSPIADGTKVNTPNKVNVITTMTSLKTGLPEQMTVKVKYTRYG